jgi:hypothetical protein
MLLTVQDVLQERVRRARTNHDSYRLVYARAVERIGRAAEMQGITSVAVEVPAFLLGRPPYKHDHAVRYTMHKLKRGGFAVDDMGGGRVLVSWSAHSLPLARMRERPKDARDTNTNNTTKNAAAAEAAGMVSKTLERLARKHL